VHDAAAQRRHLVLVIFALFVSTLLAALDQTIFSTALFVLVLFVEEKPLALTNKMSAEESLHAGVEPD